MRPNFLVQNKCVTYNLTQLENSSINLHKIDIEA